MVFTHVYGGYQKSCWRVSHSSKAYEVLNRVEQGSIMVMCWGKSRWRGGRSLCKGFWYSFLSSLHSLSGQRPHCISKAVDREVLLVQEERAVREQLKDQFLKGFGMIKYMYIVF